MDNTQLIVLVERCVMQINPDLFFDSSPLTKIRKLFRYVFQESDRNTETVAALGRYLSAKVVEAKTVLDTDPFNKHIKRRYERYSKILTIFEAVKTKNGIL